LNHSPSRFYRQGTLLPSIIIVLLLVGAVWAKPTHYSLQEGSLPVLLVSGHGGSEELPGATVRQKQDSADPHFSTAKDLVTAELTSLYSDELYRATGKRPSTIVSRIHRKYCDLNRKNEWSSAEKSGRDFHQDFHAALQQELDRILKTHGWALVLDIHGQSSEPYDLIVGTRRGRTVGPWSEGVLWAKNGLIEQLRTAGFTVTPDEPRQKTRYGGGFMVKTYGKSDAVEAWQFEHGKDLRFDEVKNQKFVRIVAALLANALGSR
jgi:N-formylglutamate amidohydrolase